MTVYRSSVRITSRQKLQAAVRRIAPRGKQGAAAIQLGCSRPRVNQLVNGKCGTWLGAKLVNALWRALRNDEQGKQLLYDATAPVGPWVRYRAWLTAEFTRLNETCGKLVAQIIRRPEGSQLKRFAETWDSVHDYRRVRLAIGRIVEPLLASHETGGVELSLEELIKTGSLEAYLTAACRREALLLKRDPDYKRAQPNP